MISVPPEVNVSPEEAVADLEECMDEEEGKDVQATCRQNGLEESLLKLRDTYHQDHNTHHDHHHNHHLGNSDLMGSRASKVSNLSVKIKLRHTHFWRRSVFWQMYILQFCSVLPGLYFAFNYREYGLFKFDDDRYVAFVGGVAMLSNGISRPCWGVLYDKFGYKRLMLVVFPTQFASLLGMTYIEGRFMFLVAIRSFLI